jgi:hypothetical protein
MTRVDLIAAILAIAAIIAAWAFLPAPVHPHGEESACARTLNCQLTMPPSAAGERAFKI